MTRDEFLKAFEQLSAEDQQAVRTRITEDAAAGGCCSEEMKKHMESMMKMMCSSENSMENCKQMMEMCQSMMQQKMQHS